MIKKIAPEISRIEKPVFRSTLNIKTGASHKKIEQFGV
jgi:hypothetical protein